ncbi:MAG: Signal transduction histidine kinase CheA [Myxococcales bacterium]|nr:Signal transduction histidine kinase CheA [Myxococcales bacterium]
MSSARLLSDSREPPARGAPATYKTEVLRQDAEFVLSRLASDGRDASFLLLAATSDAPAAASVKRLEHEYLLRDQLDSRFAAKPFALTRKHGRPALQLDDPGGQLLARLIGGPWELATFLRIAIGMAVCLRRVHERGLIHKDFKPANVLTNVATGESWLIGFGIASRLQRERRVPEPPETIAGTLAYMAPEQTGRMNRSVDSRSDLYSLGITLFEMLTGKLPFAASDPMEWVHCHIARPAPRVCDRNGRIPDQIGAVVAKLLAKPAESRYQTAAGVEADLRRCVGALESTGRIDSFPLGAADVPDRLLIPEKLYGRERDIATLLGAFDRVVASGELEVVLVSGYSGIGKSSVVNELHKALVPSRGLFASGKFDQYKRDIPYATLAHALEGLVRSILAQSEAELGRWRAAITAALGINARLMTDLIPELELVIGPSPPVPDLPPGEAQNRFQMVFRELIAVFARPEHPLALFLDDLQWLDAATLKLVEALVKREGLPLLLVGAYRSNEVHAAHPLTAALDAIRKSGTRVHDVVLAALSPEQVGQLVSDALHTNAAQAESLAHLVCAKTAGNPYFIIEFLIELAQENLLTFSASGSGWTWDAQRILAKGYTDNVVDLMARKLTRLNPATQHVLKQLACLGNRVAISTLALVHASDESVEADLWDAFRSGVVLRVDDTYAFPHDRVHEAAYSLIPEGLRTQAHLRIGRLLLSMLPRDAQADDPPCAEGEQVPREAANLFDVVSQLNRAVDLIDDPDEKATLRRLNIQAAKRAKASIAFVNARNYLALAATLLAPDAWSVDYRETFELYLLLAECEFLVGHFEIADELFGIVLDQACTKVDRAEAHCVRLQLYQVAGRYEEGFLAALPALRLFDIVLPESDADIQAAVAAQYAQVAVLLGGRAIADVVEAPQIADPSHRALMDLLVYAAPCAYIGSPRHFPLVTLTAVTLSLRHGNTDVSCRAYSAFAVMLVSMFEDIPAAYEFSEMALRLNEKLGKARDRGSILHMHGSMVVPWKYAFAKVLPIQQQAFSTSIEVGDLAYAGYVAFCSVWQLVENGDTLDDVLAGSARFAAVARQTNNDAVYQTIRLEQQFVASLQGKTDDPLGMQDASFDESASIGVVVKATFGTGIAMYQIMKEILAFHEGRYDEAHAAANAAKPLLPSIMAVPIEATHHFYEGLTMAALASRPTAEKQRSYACTLAEKAARFARWAASCPENFKARHLLLLAEIARLEARDLEAMTLYEAACRSAREYGALHDEAVALELSGQFYEARGLETTARAYFRDARHRYARWGAHGKVRQLEGRRPYLREQGSQARSTPTIGASVEDLDLATVVRVLQALASEIVLETWIGKLMTIALEDAGAQRGILFVPSPDGLQCLAEAVTGQSGIEVRMPTPTDEPPAVAQSVLRYVERTRQTVLLDDAARTSAYSTDPHIVARQSQSILCMPLVKRGELEGVLYLENNLAPGVFTPRRTAVLRLVVSQAAISLENARLYTNLQQENDARKRTEEALRRSEAFLAKAQRLSLTGSFGWNLKTGEIVWSDETYRIFAYERDTTPTLERFFQLIHPEDIQRARDLVARVQRDGEDFESELRLLLGDGSVKHVRIVGHAVGGPGTSDFVGAVMDISAAKEMAQALAFREQVMGILGHDLRNPLSAVLGIIGLAKLKGNVSAAGRQQIENAVFRMSEMIETLLDFTQTRFAGKLPISPTNMDLGEVCRRVVAELAAGHPRRVIELEVRGDLRGQWDAARLAQVISNLASNALTHGDPCAPVRLSIDGEQREVSLKVHNHGPAIAPELIPILFEPFRRGSTPDGHGPRGLGLGLHIAKQIVIAHGGSISVHSSPEEGTTLWVALPRNP